MAAVLPIAISVQTGLQIVSQLLTLIQNAHASGQPIDPAAWTATVTGPRDAVLDKLDADIQAAIQESQPKKKKK